MITRLMALCGTVLLVVGTGCQVSMLTGRPELAAIGFEPGPPQVIVLGAVVLTFAAAFAGLDDGEH